jgi:hypothetical protein
MSTFNIKKVDTFPEITRTGRTSAELQMIIDALHSSSNNGESFSILNIEEGKKFNTMQQRIRAQAKKLNYKVMIHFSRQESALYFKVITNDTKKSETSVAAKEVKSVKTNAKTTAKSNA